MDFFDATENQKARTDCWPPWRADPAGGRRGLHHLCGPSLFRARRQGLAAEAAPQAGPDDIEAAIACCAAAFPLRLRLIHAELCLDTAKTVFDTIKAFPLAVKGHGQNFKLAALFTTAFSKIQACLGEKIKLLVCLGAEGVEIGPGGHLGAHVL